MNDNEYWNKFWKMAFIALVSIISSISGCTSYTNHLQYSSLTEMVKNGANPLDARCAVSYINGVCEIRAAKKD